MDLKAMAVAMKLTDETILFVDLTQIDVRSLEKCEDLPRGLTIVTVDGPPNVEAMTRAELQAILDLKPAEGAPVAEA